MRLPSPTRPIWRTPACIARRTINQTTAAGTAPAWQAADLGGTAGVEYGRFTKRTLPTGTGTLPAAAPRYLVELLPGRVATITQPAATVASAWRPTNRTLILALGVALGIAFTVMMLTRDRSGMSVETPTGQSSASDSGIVR